jgi:ABC-type transport system involved in multi-copper enzyme maturation permease subunit
VTGQVRSELFKQRSTQTTLFLLLGMVGLVTLASALHVLAPSPSSLASPKHQLQVFEVGTRIGILFASLAGALAITAEIRYGTIRPTFLVSPRRSPVIAAKLTVGVLVGIVFGLLAEGLMAGATTAALAARGIDNQLGRGDYLQLLAGGTAAAALWATIGLGVGALVRNQVATLVGLCAWILIVENLLLPFVPSAGRFTPGATGLALAGSIADKLLGPAPAALVLVLYAAFAATAGWLATLRRDVV